METTLVRKKGGGPPVWKTDVHFSIPVRNLTLEYLSKKIKSLNYLYISEDEFNEDDWTFLQTWIQDQKIKINHINFLAITISDQNIKYIREILSKNTRIKTVTFNKYTIQNEEVFEDFCSIIRGIRNIDKIRITTNDLSNVELTKLISSISASIKEVELISEPIYVAAAPNEISEQVRKKRKFLIGMKNLIIHEKDSIGWSYNNALKYSPALTSINIMSLPKEVFSLVDSIAQNISIKKIAFTLKDWITHQKSFDNLFSTNRITYATISYSDAQFSMTDLIDTLTRPSLTSLTLIGMERHFEHMMNIPNITELNIKAFENPNYLSKFLEQREKNPTNQSVKKLWLCGGVYTRSDLFTEIMLGQLTTLKLENVLLQKGNKFDICQVLKNSTSITDLSIIKGECLDFYVPNAALTPQFYDGLADILEVNSTLKRLTLRVGGLRKENFYDKFLESLKTNKTLIHLELLTDDFYYNQIADSLLENDTLTSLHLDGPDVNLSLEVWLFEEVFATNHSLTSLTIKGINCWTELLPSLRDNRSLQTLNLSSHPRDEPNDHFWKVLGELLYTNQSLTSLTLTKMTNNERPWGREEYPILEPIQRQLRRNYIGYCNDIDSVNSFITMIQLRPDEFMAIFPLEIWLMIFQRIKFSSCNINFAEKLLNALSLNKV